MADSKITALTSIGTSTDPAVDPLVLVDVSDTSMAATGTTKKVTLNNLLSSSPTASGNFSITGDLTVRTTGLIVNSTGVGVGIAPDSAKSVKLSVYQTGDLTDETAPFTVGNTGSGGMRLYAGVNNTNEYVYIGSVKSATGYRSMVLQPNGGNLGLGVTPSAWAAGWKAIEIPGGSLLNGANTTTLIVSQNAFVSTGWKYKNNGFATRYDQDSGVHAWFNAPSGTAGNAITWTQAMTLNTNGCLALQGGNTSANGVGIAFPATQAASSDANTLDDYEEGTFTATLKGSVSDPTTPVTATARYTKIGRQVSVQIEFNNVSTAGASGNISVSGMPFQSSSAGGNTGSIISYLTATFTETLSCILGGAASSIDVYSVKSNSAWAAATHNAGSGRYLWLNVTYTVA